MRGPHRSSTGLHALTPIYCVGVGLGAVVACFGCGGVSPQRDDLPPATTQSSVVAALNGSDENEVIPDPNFQRKFTLPDLRWPACVDAGPLGELTAKSCGAGAVLFGPYARAPKNSTVAVTLEVEGLRGSTVLVADVVSKGGSRIHGWVGKRQLRAGAKETIEFGALIGASATDFETRLWSQSPDKSVAFRIVSASIETFGP